MREGDTTQCYKAQCSAQDNGHRLHTDEDIELGGHRKGNGERERERTLGSIEEDMSIERTLWSIE